MAINSLACLNVFVSLFKCLFIYHRKNVHNPVHLRPDMLPMSQNIFLYPQLHATELWVLKSLPFDCLQGKVFSCLFPSQSNQTSKFYYREACLCCILFCDQTLSSISTSPVNFKVLYVSKTYWLKSSLI